MKKINVIMLISVFLIIITGCSIIDDGISLTNVPQEYSVSEAINNGDVVCDATGKYFNSENLDKFVDSFNRKQKDAIRIVQYTDEGDPIIQILYYNGKDVSYIYDNSRDAFGAKGKGVKKTIYKKVWKETRPLELKGLGKTVTASFYYVGNNNNDKREVIRVW